MNKKYILVLCSILIVILGIVVLIFFVGSTNNNVSNIEGNGNSFNSETVYEESSLSENTPPNSESGIISELFSDEENNQSDNSQGSDDSLNSDISSKPDEGEHEGEDDWGHFGTSEFISQIIQNNKNWYDENPSTTEYKTLLPSEKMFWEIDVKSIIKQAKFKNIISVSFYETADKTTLFIILQNDKDKLLIMCNDEINSGLIEIPSTEYEKSIIENHCKKTGPISDEQMLVDYFNDVPDITIKSMWEYLER